MQSQLRTHSNEALGQAESFLEFQEQISQVAPIDRPVLLLGERGTGKELAANRLHFLSKRWDGPFITLNCSTLSPTLIESELFGYEQGAFTGAEKRRIGRFEAAHGGTLFLDEIGTIPLIAQEKILRVVEYGSFERVGSANPVEVDVRIVCATNADLPQMAIEGKFKRDLLDRLSFEVLYLPPLRHRKEDIPLLAQHFGARMAYELGHSDPPSFSQEAMELLLHHQWHGNIRELKNVVERAVYKSGTSTIRSINFNPFTSPFSEIKSLQVNKVELPEQESRVKQSPSLKEAVKELEKHMLEAALQETQYNQKKAAEKLDLTYDQLRGLLRKYRKEINKV